MAEQYSIVWKFNLVHSSSNTEHWSCFQFLAILNNTMRIILVYKSLNIFQIMSSEWNFRSKGTHIFKALQKKHQFTFWPMSNQSMGFPTFLSDSFYFFNTVSPYKSVNWKNYVIVFICISWFLMQPNIILHNYWPSVCFLLFISSLWEPSFSCYLYMFFINWKY